MTKLYVANITHQNFYFMAREPESGVVIEKSIYKGQQDIVYDGSSDIVSDIIAQHERYGMKSASEIKSAKEFTGTCYSIDKPVPIGSMKSAIESNFSALKEQGKETRKKAGTYGSAVIDGKSREIGENAGNITVELSNADEDPEYAEIYSEAPPTNVSRRGRSRK